MVNKEAVKSARLCYLNNVSKIFAAKAHDAQAGGWFKNCDDSDWITCAIVAHTNPKLLEELIWTFNAETGECGPAEGEEEEEGEEPVPDDIACRMDGGFWNETTDECQDKNVACEYHGYTWDVEANLCYLQCKAYLIFDPTSVPQ